MIRGRTGLIIQIIGVLTLILGNFFTAGQAVADVATTDEVTVENARFEDDHRQMVANTQVGKKANLAFDLTVGALSQNGSVKFDYDEEALNIKKRRYKYSNGNTAVVVDIDGKDSVVHWRHAVGKTSLDIKLPVKFNRAMTQTQLAIAVDHKLVQLPMMTVLAKGAKVDQQQANSASGNLQADNKINAMLQQEQSEQAAETAKKEAKEQQPESQKESESEQKDNQNAPTNREQSEAYLVKKKKADQEQAREKTKQAVEQKKEAQTTDQSSATNNLSGDEAAKMPETSRTPRSVGGMTDLKDALSLADTDDDPDPDANDNEAGADIRRTAEAAKVFESRVGRNLNELVENQFFTEINLSIDGNNVDIPPYYDPNNDDVEIPSDIHTSSNSTITWKWDTKTIAAKNPKINKVQDGDFYTFTLSGFTFDYGNSKEVVRKIYSATRVEIGTFTIRPHEEDGKIIDSKHDITIEFTIPDNLKDTTIRYSANMITKFSSEAGEVKFGEIAEDGVNIPIESAKVSLAKKGSFYKHDGITDYERVHWVSDFTVLEGDGAEGAEGAENVELTDYFGTGYTYGLDDVQYKIIVNAIDGGTAEPEISSVTDNTSITKRLVFDANKLLGDGKKIKSIHIETIHNVTDQKQTSFKNEIAVTKCQIGTDDVTTGKVSAEIQRKDESLKKAFSNITEDGRVRYKVRFTVGGDPKDKLIMVDTLQSTLFHFSESDLHYELYFGDDRDNNLFKDHADRSIGTESGKPTLTLTFNNLGPGTYYVYYQIVPNHGTQDSDYKNLTNTVTWQGKESSTVVHTPEINVKKNVSVDWEKMTTDWKININQTNRKITTPVKITEPTQSTGEYLDFEKYFEDLKADTFQDISKYLKFYQDHVAEKNQVDFINDSGSFYWNEDDKENQQQAFTIELDSNQLVIEVLKLPTENTSKLGISYHGVPIKKEKIAKHETSKIRNCADILYNSESHEVCDEVRLPDFMKKHIAKTGKLSPKFHDPSNSEDRYIDWQVSFNHRAYIGEDDLEKMLVGDGLDISDVLGKDVITGYENSATKTHQLHLQDIKDVLDSLKVSLAPLNSSGTGFGELNPLGKSDFDIVNGNVTNTKKDRKFGFKLKLTEEGLKKYKAGNEVFVLDFRTKVPSLKVDESNENEHLKNWKFNNQITVSGFGSYGDQGEMSTKAHVSYTDNGHLLDKSGALTTIEQQGQERNLSGIKWQVLLNGDKKEITTPVKITDKIEDLNHHHLITQDERYHVKLFEAKRTNVMDKNGNYQVKYEPDLEKEIKRSDFKVVYSPDLDQMTLDFAANVMNKKPIIVQYYTVRENSEPGGKYENKVTLAYGEKEISEIEKIESEANVWGSYDLFAVNLVKTDAETNKPLEGVQFKLQKLENGKWVTDTYTDTTGEIREMIESTNEDGMASFNNLGDLPTYRIVESEGNPGYYDSYQSEPFTIDDVKDGTVKVLKVKNTRSGDLIVKKKVISNVVSPTKDKFKFEVRITDKNGEVDQDFNGEFSIRIDGNEEIEKALFKDGLCKNLPEISADQRIRIVGLPRNAYFQVIEVDSDEYQTTHDISQLLVIEDNGNDGKESHVLKLQDQTGDAPGIITFTNKQKQNQFEFEKIVSGKTTNEPFKFEISTKGDTKDVVKGKQFDAKVVSSVTHEQISHGKLKFDDDGIAKKIEYPDNTVAPTDILLRDNEKLIVSELPDKATEFLIQEVGYEEKDWTVYNHIHGEYERNGDKANLKLNRKNALNSVMFRNTGPDCVPFTIRKLISGNIDNDKQFEFKLSIEDPKLNWGETKKFNAARSGSGDEEEVPFTKEGDRYVATVKLEANESLTLFMDKDLKLSVTEVLGDEDKNNYQVTHQYGGKWISGTEANVSTGPQNSCNNCLPPLVFKNHLPGGSLKISKVVVADDLTNEDKQRDFKFKVMCDKSMAGKKFATTKFNQDGTTSEGTLEFNDSSSETISLRHGESLEIHDLPTDVKFAVQELTENGEAHGFKVSHTYDHGVEQEKDKTIDFNLKDAKRSTVVFKNTRLSPKTANLQINKQFAGAGINEADHDRNFDFTITSDEMLNEEFTAQKQHQSGSSELTTVNFVRGVAKVSLKAGESLNITGLPIDYHYQVTETRNAEFATTYQVNKGKVTTGNATQSFKLLDQQNGQVTFTNAKDKPTTTELTISKKLAGNHISSADKDRSFKFVLYTTAVGDFEAVKTDRDGDNHEVTITIRNGISDSIELKGDESLRIKGLPTTAHYQVGEAFTTDFAASYQVNGASVLEGLTTKQFKLTKDRPGTVAFTNTKDKVTENGAFAISKFVNAAGDRNRAFQFNVMLTDGAGNLLNGTFAVNKVTNGVSETGQLTVIDGKTTFSLKHGQTLVIHAPLGVRYEIAEHRYTQLGYTTTATKNKAAVSGSTVTGTVTMIGDHLIYHNDIQDTTDSPAPLPGLTDNDDSNGNGSADLEDPDGLPGQTSPSGTTSGSSGIQKPMGMPSQGYTSKAFLPQTGDDLNQWLSLLGVVLGIIGIAGMVYIRKRKV